MIDIVLYPYKGESLCTYNTRLQPLYFSERYTINEKLRDETAGKKMSVMTICTREDNCYSEPDVSR